MDVGDQSIWTRFRGRDVGGHLEKRYLLAGKPEEARTPGMGDGREEELGLTLTDERRSFMSTRSH